MVAVVGGPDGSGRLQPIRDDGTPDAPAVEVDDLAAAVARHEADAPRWLWPSGAALYPRLVKAGVRVGRCHDLELTEALLLGHAGRWGEPLSPTPAFMICATCTRPHCSLPGFRSMSWPPGLATPTQA